MNQHPLIAPALPTDPIGIYIHIPFCAHICPYCDFTTYAGKESLIPRYVDALRREIAEAGAIHDGRDIATIFVGGGTPSLLDAAQMASLIAACRDAFPVEPDAEVSIEANPNGLTAGLLAGYRDGGVNRLSIGAQTFDRRGLRTLGRHHESGDVLTALNAAREAGLRNASIDLIFGWPRQTLDQFAHDLDELIAIGGADGLIDHVSMYSLIVEPGTPFADAAARGILHMPDDDATADMYELAMIRLAEAGWLHYEVSNWARNPEFRSRHNALYWRHADYYGFGAGAHGTVRGVRTMNQPSPERYCTLVEVGESPASNRERVEGELARGETMMLGLRLIGHGVDAAAFATRYGVPLDEAFGPEIAELAAMGMLERDERGVRLTPRGLLLANDVAERFLA
ncbi:MAG: radical SAM family heme chaperone HemW [Thermomicrobiales bacterium]